MINHIEKNYTTSAINVGAFSAPRHRLHRFFRVSFNKEPPLRAKFHVDVKKEERGGGGRKILEIREINK